jgi:NADPH2:quinone reductase
MRAFVFDEPGAKPHVRDVPAPAPGPGQVLIAVRFAGFNFADVLGARGEPGYAPGWPFIPGLEIAGEIAAIGTGVPDFEVGQTVVALSPSSGAYAEFALASAMLTVAVPAGLPLPAATAVPLSVSTAALLLGAGDVGAGHTVLVHSAAGALGRILAVMGRRCGAEQLIGLVGRPESANAAKAAGYDDVFVRADGWPDQVLEVTGGRGVDAAFDPIGGTSIKQSLRVTAAGGRLVSFGNAAGEPDATVSVAELRRLDVSVGGHSTLGTARTRPDVVAEEMRAGLDLLSSGALDLEPEVVPLREADGVYQGSTHRSTGKVVFAISA